MMITSSRRYFLKTVLFLTGAIAISPFKIFAKKNIFTKNKIFWPDLIGVKDGSAAQMFEVGIKALGGMKRFVRQGQTVLIKPNIGWNKTPSEGANTQPDLVGMIVKHAYQAGAKQVYVFDHTCNRMEDCYQNSGIKKAVEDNKGKMMPSDDEKYYKEVTIKKAKILKKAKVHKTFLEADVLINVPVLKNHGSTRMTSALKNYMGVVWDRRWWHRNNLHQCIADFALLRKADLTVVDAYSVMMKNGPMGVSVDDLAIKRMQILSTDTVLCDTAASRVLNLKLKDVPYLKMAEKHGLGTTDIDSKRVQRISCSS